MHDLIVVGGGPAGHTAAEHAAKSGLNTLLVEKSDLGGVCLNHGCIPSKALLHCVKRFSMATHSAAFGVTAQGVSFDVPTVMARKQKLVETLRSGLAFTLSKCKVEIVSGQATILGASANGFRVEVNKKEFEARRLILCTGSEAVRLPIPGAQQNFVMTNKEILSISSISSNITIIGGGAIGLEFASFFAEAGSHVSVVELLPTIGGRLDKDIAASLKKSWKRKEFRFTSIRPSRVSAIMPLPSNPQAHAKTFPPKSFS